MCDARAWPIRPAPLGKSQTTYCPAPWPDMRTQRNANVAARACPLGRSHRQHHKRQTDACGKPRTPNKTQTRTPGTLGPARWAVPIGKSQRTPAAQWPKLLGRMPCNRGDISQDYFQPTPHTSLRRGVLGKRYNETMGPMADDRDRAMCHIGSETNAINTMIGRMGMGGDNGGN